MSRQPCDDGTGALDCCKNAILGGPCLDSDGPCWTRCNYLVDGASDGMRSQMLCAGGRWLAGHGQFPCAKADTGF
jgi:hypothetical protein